MKRFACLFLLLAPTTVGAQPAPRGMTVDDLFRFKRVADPHISPDGKWVAYAVGNVDMEGNRVVYNLWLACTQKAPLKRTATPPQKRAPVPPAGPPTASRFFSSRAAPAPINCGSSNPMPAK